jgi:aminopeptidase
MNDAIIDRYADLIVGFGANVQPDQIVGVSSEIGKEPLTRAIAASAYRRGARFVDGVYFDPYVKRQRLLYAAEDTLEFVPPWYGERLLELSEHRAATVALTGSTTPGLFEDLDPGRAGRDRLPALKETGQVVNARRVNWTASPCPSVGWARAVHPGLDAPAALERLWEQIAHVCRLDTEDPVKAWQGRIQMLSGAAERLTAHRFDALHFEGPGTDLRIGLMPSSRWIAARFSTAAGIVHMPNLPTEEVFTTPDPLRVDGMVRSTKPLVLTGTTVRGLELRFAGGRAVEICADTGQDVLRTLVSSDDGAARLGEVALVDGQGRIGPLNTVFYDTLLDENAASHIALGTGFEFAVAEEDRPAVNQSAIHVDFMIGGDDVAVTGIGVDGDRVPVLRGGVWQI